MLNPCQSGGITEDKSEDITIPLSACYVHIAAFLGLFGIWNYLRIITV